MLLTLLMLVGLNLGAPADPVAVEREAKQIERLIIAPCCWTQPVSDHYSAEADEIRAGIRRMLTEGKTRQQILDAYVMTYGERVLAEPPARGFKASLHVLPWIFLVLGAVVVAGMVWRARNRRLVTADAGPARPDARAVNGDDYAERLDQELKKLD